LISQRFSLHFSAKISNTVIGQSTVIRAKFQCGTITVFENRRVPLRTRTFL
jgi:hypothetical protein